MSRLTGTISFWHHEKLYGFISPEDGSANIFVHISALPDGVVLSQGDRVTFETENNPRGPKAVNVQVA